MGTRVATYNRQVVAELRKVIWPTRNELVTYTIVSIVFVTAMVALVALYDFVFTKGVLAIFGSATHPVPPTTSEVFRAVSESPAEQPAGVSNEPLSEQAEAIEEAGDLVPATAAGSGADTIDEEGLGLSDEPAPGYLQPDEQTTPDPTAEHVPVATPEFTAAPTEEEPAAAEAATNGAEPADDEDPVEAFRDRLRILPGDWYVVHTYAGYENKVKANLETRIASLNMEDYIFQIEVPTQDETVIKQGKRQVVQSKVFPGYVLVRMDLTDESWSAVKNTPSVTGFVGTTHPTPLTIEEVV